MNRLAAKACALRPFSPLLYAALCLALLLPACKSVPFFGGGFKVEIEPMAQVSQLQGLYVIVSPQSDVAEALQSEDFSLLLEEKKIENVYTSFRQFAPTETGGWREEFKANESSLVTYKVKDSLIEVEVSKDIGGTQGIQYNIVVLGFFGGAGFKHVTIRQPVIDEGVNQRVEIGAAMLSMTGIE